MPNIWKLFIDCLTQAFYACVCVCVTCVHERGSPQSRSNVFIGLHLMIWGGVSQWTWNMPIQLGCLTTELRGSKSFSRSPKNCTTKLSFDVRTGDLNLGLHLFSPYTGLKLNEVHRLVNKQNVPLCNNFSKIKLSTVGRNSLRMVFESIVKRFVSQGSS